MAVPQKKIKTEISDFDLIECTRQPGNLRISKQACARRFEMAQNQRSLGPKGHFGVAYHWSLEKCQNCPKGRSFSKSIQKKKRAKTA
ncbi:MAG: hypothetical protein JW932_18680 [Deltaproteobacteria bacterium]|nr:hypothetical protein [Deltaproteobacteria bacterium]